MPTYSQADSLKVPVDQQDPVSIVVDEYNFIFLREPTDMWFVPNGCILFENTPDELQVPLARCDTVVHTTFYRLTAHGACLQQSGTLASGGKKSGSSMHSFRLRKPSGTSLVGPRINGFRFSMGRRVCGSSDPVAEVRGPRAGRWTWRSKLRWVASLFARDPIPPPR